jgi:hypothetical protein
VVLSDGLEKALGRVARMVWIELASGGRIADGEIRGPAVEDDAMHATEETQRHRFEDGIDVCRRLRQDVGARSVTLDVVVGHAEQELVHRTRRPAVALEAQRRAAVFADSRHLRNPIVGTCPSEM